MTQVGGFKSVLYAMEVVNESWADFPSNLAVRFEVLGFDMIFNFASDWGQTTEMNPIMSFASDVG